jgi:hypothetical protein
MELSELVQAGTADSGKSHVSTPDYLEKRLRARRKSGSALISGMFYNVFFYFALLTRLNGKKTPTKIFNFHESLKKQESSITQAF